MSQTLTLKIRGRYTHPNELSEVPDGALSVAKNVNIDEESIATPRRGYNRMTYALGTSTDRIKTILEYRDTLIVQYNTNTLARDTGSAWSNYSGTYAPPDSTTPIRSVQANENFYFTTSTGVFKLDSVSGTPAEAGAPKGLTIESALTSVSSGFLTAGNAVAYRVVWGIKDANNNLILGAPSERLVVSNGTANDEDVDITVTIPAGITTSHFVQLYRSQQVLVGVEPSEEMQLTYEEVPTGTQITNKTMTIRDNRDDSILGATIYTAPSQDTIVLANETPPFAKDIAVFKNHVFYLNTVSKHRLRLTILGADGGASPGTALQVDDVLTIAGVTYTGKAATNVASRQFAVSTSSSAAVAIRDTALALIKVINQNTSNTTIYAYYISGVDDTPGQILLESRAVGGSSFSVTYTPNSHSGNPFQPELPASGTTVSSANDTFKNALYFSKLGRPEAVPLVNLFRIGSADEDGIRIIPLRDSLFILKTDGVYRLTGEDAGSFRVELFDNTATIRAANSATTLNNALFFLSDQGVVQATETGISVVSRPIEIDFLELFGTVGLANVRAYSFAVGYETERKYVLGVPVSSADTSAKKFHVYNTFTNAWTTWEDLDVVAGKVKSTDDKLYLAPNSAHYLLKEAKTYSISDFSDYGLTVTISAIDGTVLTVTNSDQISIGDVIQQSASVFSLITAVDSVAGKITVEFDAGFTAASADVFKSINCEIEWVPIHGGNPSILKHFREVSFLFKKSFTSFATATFFSDASQSPSVVTIPGRGLGFFGYFVFGSIPFGGISGRFPVRTWVPLTKQRCTQLSVRFSQSVAYSDFKLSGFAAHFREISERFNR